MSRMKPVTLSSTLGISSKDVHNAGVIDVTLNCDTNLFIDPLLMKDCSDKVFASCAHDSFVERFDRVIRLIQAIQSDGDKAERAAQNQLSFPEIRFTHLGFSKGKGGAGFGSKLTMSLVDSAKQVIKIGTNDPDLFLALALFEENVGPDRIGDMTTNIVISCLSEFNSRAAKRFNLTISEFEVAGRRLQFPVNPIASNEPLILVPKDIVRQLPTGSDWDSIRSAARSSSDFRRDVNTFIGSIWEAKSKQQKKTIKNTVLQSRKAFEELLYLIRSAADEAYDVNGDVAGELYPSDLEREISSLYPLDLKSHASKRLDLPKANYVVEEIIKHFQGLIEDNGIWKELWLDDKVTPRLEKAMQRIFYVVASAYCRSNNLDLSPEADSGAGPVDFKISTSGEDKVLVEIKRSRNTQLVSGYTSQLEIYKRAENTMRAHYVVIDVGNFTPELHKRLIEKRDNAMQVNGVASTLWIIDGSVRESASKRKTRDSGN